MPALHVVFLPCNRTGLRLPPPVVYVLDYLFINQIFHISFPSSHFAQASVLPCLTITPVTIPSIMVSLFPKLHWLPHSPTPLHPTADIKLTAWHHTTETFHRPHSSRYKHPIAATGFLLDSWTLTMGPIGVPKTSIRNYHYSLRKNSEQRSSQSLKT